MFVRKRFQKALSNLELTDIQVEDGLRKSAGVTSSLNRNYWDEPNDFKNSITVGSWGKDTAIRPPTDIDQFFILPVSEYHSSNARQGNVQSQLLQSVRSVLSDTYVQTTIRGDGQVVVVAFNSITIEVVPAFHAQGGGYLICDTNDGGRWKRVDPLKELSELASEDHRYAGNVRKLTKLLKRWKYECNVPIKSFHIERLVTETLAVGTNSLGDEFWHDWLVRDVLRHMLGRVGQGFYMPGSNNEWIDFGDQWLSRTQTAYERALKACDFEYRDMEVSAGLEWQKIFGTTIPAAVGQ